MRAEPTPHAVGHWIDCARASLDLAGERHERLGGRRKRAAAPGDETVIEAEKRRLGRQEDEIADGDLRLDLEWEACRPRRPRARQHDCHLCDRQRPSTTSPSALTASTARRCFSKQTATSADGSGGEPAAESEEAGAYARQVVSLRANEAAVTIVIEHEEPLSLSGRARQSGHSLRHRRWASGLSMVGRAKDLGQGGVTRLAAAARDDRPSALSAAVHGGGEGNPLDARALYLGPTVFRIHSANEPETIGRAVSPGCFRLVHDDVVDLYARVQIGAKVISGRTPSFEIGEIHASLPRALPSGAPFAYVNDGAYGPCPSRRLAQGREIETIWHFPPRQKPGSFSVGDALQKLTGTGHSDDLALGRCGRPGCLTAGAERDGKRSARAFKGWRSGKKQGGDSAQDAGRAARPMSCFERVDT